jgi:glycerophosphoryl diester phosphodiesterase
MLIAFGRLFLIAAATFISMFLVVFVLRQLGLTTQHSAYSHPLIGEKRWVVAMGGDPNFGPAYSRSALAAAAKNNSHYFIGLRIRATQDSEWVVYGSQNLADLTDTSGFIIQKNFNELKNVKYKNSSETLVPLDEAFSLIQKKPIYIIIDQPAGPHLEKLYSLIETNHAEERVVLSSQFMDTNLEIRKKSARWLTGASTSELAKFRFMSSILLETTTELAPDVFVLSKINTRMVDELIRRKKVILIETDEPERFKSALSQYPSIGILTTRPSQFTQMVDSATISH